jgi:hypothetical protein
MNESPVSTLYRLQKRTKWNPIDKIHFSVELFICSFSQTFFDMISQRLKTENMRHMKKAISFSGPILGHMYNYAFSTFSRTLSNPFPVDLY